MNRYHSPTLLMFLVGALTVQGVLAGEPAHDPQIQAQELLLGAGTSTKHVHPPAVRASNDHQAYTMDSQEQARELILGVSHFHQRKHPTLAADAGSSWRDRGYVDPQDSARLMIVRLMEFD